MTGDSLPIVRLAAVQAAPVFLDREATIEKACGLIREAGAAGAQVIGFPEGFVPAHPLWFHFHSATSAASNDFSQQLHRNSVVVPSPATDALASAARDAHAAVVIGICERDSNRIGVLYNSQLAIDADGTIVGVRRKLMPTVGERLVHVPGSGDSVRAFALEIGTVSGLMCGENSNALAAFAMGALGASIHVAAWPSFFNPGVDMQAIADVAARSLAYQNACFVINVIGAVDDAMLELLPRTDEDREFVAAARQRGGSAIYAPGGALLAGPVSGAEQILYADADLERIVPRKIQMDYAGNYNRFDIFQLSIRGAQHPSIAVTEQADTAQSPRLISETPRTHDEPRRST